jgi:hypothetical protein
MPYFGDRIRSALAYAKLIGRNRRKCRWVRRILEISPAVLVWDDKSRGEEDLVEGFRTKPAKEVL